MAFELFEDFFFFLGIEVPAAGTVKVTRGFPYLSYFRPLGSLRWGGVGLLSLEGSGGR